LINNIAQWLQIDPYTLLSNTFGGSGYDIACAQNNTPIVYQRVEGKPIVSPVTFLSGMRFEYLFLCISTRNRTAKVRFAAYRSKSHALENLIPVFDELYGFDIAKQ